MGNNLDLDDARRLIASLNGLKLWIDGAPDKPGVLVIMEKVLTELNKASDEIMNLRNENLNEFSALLQDTVHSAIAVQNEQSSMDIEAAIQNMVGNLPSDVAKIILKALRVRPASKAINKEVLDLKKHSVNQSAQITVLKETVILKDDRIKSLNQYLVVSACIAGLSLSVLIVALFKL
jgi:5'-3' exonuclease